MSFRAKKNNKYVYVLEKVKKNGMLLEKASEELRNNRDIVSAAILENPKAIEFAGDEMKNDFEIIKQCVQKDGYLLKFASDEMKDNDQIVLAAICNNGFSIRFASEKLRKNKGIVLTAINNNGYSLKFADENLKKDKDFLCNAVFQNDDSLETIDHGIMKKYEDELIRNMLEGFTMKIQKEPTPQLHFKRGRTEFSLFEYRRCIEDMIMCMNFKNDEDFPHNYEIYLKKSFGILIMRQININDWIDIRTLQEFFEKPRSQKEFSDIHSPVKDLHISTLTRKFPILKNKELTADTQKRVSSIISDCFDGILNTHLVREKSDDKNHLIYYGIINPRNKTACGVGFEFLVKNKALFLRKIPHYHRTFFGKFKNGLRNGMGVVYNPKTLSKVYQGYFKNGFRCGKGMEFDDSCHVIYEGLFKNGERDGEGEMYSPEKQKFFRGVWKNGKLEKTHSSYDCTCILFQNIKPFLTHTNIIGKGGYGIIYRINVSLIPELFDHVKNFNSVQDNRRKSQRMFNNRKSIIFNFNEEFLLDVENLLNSNNKNNNNNKNKENNSNKHNRIISNSPGGVEDLGNLFLAVKIFNPSEFQNDVIYREIMIRKLRTSIELLAQVKDKKHILSILGLIEGDQIGYITAECKISVDRLILLENSMIPEQEKFRILYQTAKGMKSLHFHNIMHRDLKWGNILLDQEGIVKITDLDTIKEDQKKWKLSFKHTHFIQNSSSGQGGQGGQIVGFGTSEYISPEILTGAGKYGLEVDVYSFGIMIYALLFEYNSPYKSQYQCQACGTLMKNINSYDLIVHVAKHNFRPLIDNKKIELISKEYRFLIDLMILCWDSDPLKRPNFNQIVEILETEKYKKKCYSIINILFFPSNKNKEVVEEEMEGEFNIKKNNNNNFNEKDLPKFKILLMKPKLNILIELIQKKMKCYEGVKIVSITYENQFSLKSDEDVAKMVGLEDHPSVVVEIKNFEMLLKKIKKRNSISSSKVSNTSNNLELEKKVKDLENLNLKIIKENKELKSTVEELRKKILLLENRKK